MTPTSSMPNTTKAIRAAKKTTEKLHVRTRAKGRNSNQSSIARDTDSLAVPSQPSTRHGKRQQSGQQKVGHPTGYTRECMHFAVPDLHGGQVLRGLDERCDG
eukprot:scaffold705_cov402-Prasinococcus_capsulatus_cf.AAC.19